MDYEGTTATLEQASDLEKNPAGVVKRWLLELKLADKRESDWRKKAEKVWNRYRQKDSKKASFNILWANTETLRPAVYNSLPSPDVRRRFKDADPLGKAGAEVLYRALEYGLDTTDFDDVVKLSVLDMLLPGRGVVRVRYVPSLRQVGVTEETHAEENEVHAEGEEAGEGYAEELEWEQAPLEHVQWDDFRLSYGKEWCEVCWIAFRHRLTRDELIEQFGEEIGRAIKLDATDDEDIKNERDERVQDSFKTAEVWEIWDKDTMRVLFICQGYKEQPLKVVDDPLNLIGFFPIPRPLYAIEDSSSLVPVPLYELYKEQADELDAVSRRINVLIKGLKLRGIYDSTLTELSEIMRGEDNDLIPAANVTALLERGGLEKAIWFMPIDKAAMVLKELYIQREQCKAVIYEITGISDILRGSTDAEETATAQQIKSQWGSNRLKRMQAEVARFIRDLVRLQGEIIAEKFQPETLATMTQIKLPTPQDKMMALQQYQEAKKQGQQVPEPEVLKLPTWEEVIQLLRDDKQRTFKIDIETDSTIAASIEEDMQGLREVLTGIVEVVQGLGPAVQMGAMPIDALKEIILTICRRAKMGNAVEDALDKIQQPPPQAQQQDNSAQVEQMKQQAENERLAQSQNHEMQMKQMELQHEAQVEGGKQALEAKKLDTEAQLKQAELAIKNVELQIKQAELALKEKELTVNASLQNKQLDNQAEQADKALQKEAAE
jgi:hypothetical protein